MFILRTYQFFGTYMGVFRNVWCKLTTSPAYKTARSHVQMAFSHKYLFYTNVMISFTLSGLGDCIEQHYEKMTGEIDRYSLQRTKHMTCAGVMIGIFCHHWYRYLDNALRGNAIQTVVRKVLIDQMVCSPVTVSLYFIATSVSQRHSLEEFLDEVKHKALRLYVAEWLVWPPAQMINFYLLPPRYRVLYDNMISLGYDIYTSAVLNTKHHKVDEHEDNEHEDTEVDGSCCAEQVVTKDEDIRNVKRGVNENADKVDAHIINTAGTRNDKADINVNNSSDIKDNSDKNDINSECECHTEDAKHKDV